MGGAYYNEIDPYAAAWLRNLIAAGHIAPGVVDTRSIENVRPDELTEFTQCHFFAGIGGWALSLDLAGWPRDKPVWTGSCPCQPFSAAGKGAGFDDERHLWPAWFHIIEQRRPPVVFGEQVASKAVDAWIDLVHADLEGMGYAFGSIPFPAAGIGAPHIRDRNYWVAHTNRSARDQGRSLVRGRIDRGNALTRTGFGGGGLLGGLANPDGRHASAEGLQRSGEHGQQQEDGRALYRAAGVGRVADTSGAGLSERERNPGIPGVSPSADPWETPERGSLRATTYGSASPTDGFWRNADRLACRDGKWRPVEPGTFPLAHGVSGRVGRLRAYGNAIVPQQAAHFVQAVMEAAP